MHWRSICWLAHSMRWVLITPLGDLVEPEVNRNLAIVSGPTAAWARSAAGPGAVSSRLAKLRTARPSIAPSLNTNGTSAATVASMALA